MATWTTAVRLSARIDATLAFFRAFKSYPIGYFDIDIAEVRTEQGKQEGHNAGLGRLPAPSPRSRALQGPHRADRQRHPVHDAGRWRLGRSGDPGSSGKGRTLPGAR